MALYAACGGEQWAQAGGWREAAERREPPMFWTEAQQLEAERLAERQRGGAAAAARARDAGNCDGPLTPAPLKGCAAVVDEFSFGWFGLDLDLEEFNDENDDGDGGGGGGGGPVSPPPSRRPLHEAPPRRRRPRPGLELDLSYNKLRGRLPTACAPRSRGRDEDTAGAVDDAAAAAAAVLSAAPSAVPSSAAAATNPLLALSSSPGDDHLVAPRGKGVEMVAAHCGAAAAQPRHPQRPFSPVRPLPEPWPGCSVSVGLGGLARVLTKLHLVGNGLQGPLPRELGLLGRLTELCLGHNALSGPVEPRSLFGRLRSLRTLSLTCNKLTGRAPDLGPLAALEVLGWLDGTAGHRREGRRAASVRLGTALPVLSRFAHIMRARCLCCACISPVCVSRGCVLQI
jgi:hypothetical protein